MGVGGGGRYPTVPRDWGEEGLGGGGLSNCSLRLGGRGLVCLTVVSNLGVGSRGVSVSNCSLRLNGGGGGGGEEQFPFLQSAPACDWLNVGCAACSELHTPGSQKHLFRS